MTKYTVDKELITPIEFMDIFANATIEGDLLTRLDECHGDPESLKEEMRDPNLMVVWKAYDIARSEYFKAVPPPIPDEQIVWQRCGNCTHIDETAKKCGFELETGSKFNPLDCPHIKDALKDAHADENYNKAFINFLKICIVLFKQVPWWRSRMGWFLWFAACYANPDAYYPLTWESHFEPEEWYHAGEPPRPPVAADPERSRAFVLD